MIVFYHFFFFICGPLLINPIIGKQKFSLEKNFMIAEGPNRLFIWANNLKLRLIVSHWSWQCYPLSCWASEKTESNRTSIAWWINLVGYIYILYYIGIPRYLFLDALRNILYSSCVRLLFCIYSSFCTQSVKENKLINRIYNYLI